MTKTEPQCRSIHRRFRSALLGDATFERTLLRRQVWLTVTLALLTWARAAALLLVLGLAAPPAGAEDLLRRGFEQLEARNYAGALETARHLDSHPQPSAPRERRLLLEGLAERGLGRLDAAVELLRGALGLAPEDTTIRTELAVTLSWSSRLGEALTEYERLLERDPNNTVAAAGRARILGWQQRFDDAREGFRALLDRDPNHLEALLGMAAVERGASRSARSRSWYELVLRLDPDNSEALAGLEALARQTRGQVTRGLVTSHDGRPRPGVRLTYAFRPGWRMTARGEERTAGIPGAGEPRGAALRSLGVERRYRRFTLAALADRSLAEIQRTRALNLEGAIRVRGLGFDLGARFAETDGTTARPLMFGGLSLSTAIGVIRGQMFVSGSDSWVVAGGLSRSWGSRRQLQLGFSQGSEQGRRVERYSAALLQPVGGR
ncbi:MAG: tetratricopeptide repeat protein, partial [Acidobacteriota bacterium]